MRFAAFERLFAWHALRHAPFGEFDDDDGVIDQHAHGKG